MQGKKLLLIIGGGIAAYKMLDFIRRAREQGAAVRVIMTAAASHFITPLSVAALTGDKVYQDLFDLTDEAEMGHIQLSRDADLLIVAPATADLMAKMAGGHANDLATTALLATDKPVMIAPAMNVRMWQHPATRRNLAQLQADGIRVVGPAEGAMACGEFGPGRMAEPADLLAAAIDFFGEAANPPLKGRHVLVTAGPTHEPIDPVRYIANRSSGKQGYAIARALAQLGARVTLVSGPTDLAAPAGVRLVRTETAREMLAASLAALPADAAVMTAAVADWRPVLEGAEKIKKVPGAAPPALKLAENPDILATLSAAGAQRPGLVVGFAAETQNLLENARSKLARKGCDWVVANDVSPGTGIMGGDHNAVTLVTAAGDESWPQLSKAEVAARLARRIADQLGAAP